MRQANHRDTVGDLMELHTKWDEDNGALVTMPMAFLPRGDYDGRDTESVISN